MSWVKRSFKIVKISSDVMNYSFAMLSGVLLFSVALLICVDVLIGFLLNRHIPGEIEIVVLTIPWVISLGLAYALIKGAHVRVTLIADRLTVRNRLWLLVFSHALGMIFFGVLTYSAWLHFWSSWVIREAMFAALMELPWWLGKLSLPVGMFLIAFQHLLEAIHTLSYGE